MAFPDLSSSQERLRTSLQSGLKMGYWGIWSLSTVAGCVLLPFLAMAFIFTLAGSKVAFVGLGLLAFLAVALLRLHSKATHQLDAVSLLFDKLERHTDHVAQTLGNAHTELSWLKGYYDVLGDFQYLWPTLQAATQVFRKSLEEGVLPCRESLHTSLAKDVALQGLEPGKLRAAVDLLYGHLANRLGFTELLRGVDLNSEDVRLTRVVEVRVQQTVDDCQSKAKKAVESVQDHVEKKITSVQAAVDDRLQSVQLAANTSIAAVEQKGVKLQEKIQQLEAWKVTVEQQIQCLKQGSATDRLKMLLENAETIFGAAKVAPLREKLKLAEPQANGTLEQTALQFLTQILVVQITGAVSAIPFCLLLCGAAVGSLGLYCPASQPQSNAAACAGLQFSGLAIAVMGAVGLCLGYTMSLLLQKAFRIGLQVVKSKLHHASVDEEQGLAASRQAQGYGSL